MLHHLGCKKWQKHGESFTPNDLYNVSRTPCFPKAYFLLISNVVFGVRRPQKSWKPKVDAFICQHMLFCGILKIHWIRFGTKMHFGNSLKIETVPFCDLALISACTGPGSDLVISSSPVKPCLFSTYKWKKHQQFEFLPKAKRTCCYFIIKFLHLWEPQMAPGKDLWSLEDTWI